MVVAIPLYWLQSRYSGITYKYLMVEYWWQQVFWQYFKGAGGCRAISVEPNHRPGSFAAALDVSCRSDPIPTFPLTPAPIIEQHKIRPSPIFGVLKLDNTQCLESARNRMLQFKPSTWHPIIQHRIRPSYLAPTFEIIQHRIKMSYLGRTFENFEN